MTDQTQSSGDANAPTVDPALSSTNLDEYRTAVEKAQAPAAEGDDDAGDKGDDKAPEKAPADATAAVEGDKKDTPPDDSAKKDDAGDQKPPKKSFKERMAEKTAETYAARKEAEVRAAELEAANKRIAELEAKKPEKTETKTDAELLQAMIRGEVEPDAEKFPYGTLDPRWSVAVANHASRLTEERVRASMVAERQAEAEQQRTAELHTKSESLGERGYDKFGDDFLEKVVENGAKTVGNLSTEMGLTLLDSEVGHEILYHLATNPSEASKVRAMTPLQQVAYVGRMEARLSQPNPDTGKSEQNPKTKTSSAPEPVKQVRGVGGKFSASPDTTDLTAYRALVESNRT